MAGNVWTSLVAIYNNTPVFAVCVFMYTHAHVFEVGYVGGIRADKYPPIAGNWPEFPACAHRYVCLIRQL